MDRSRDAGFTLLEVLMAMLLVAVVAAGVAELTTIAARATHAARTQTVATMAAMQKMEELRSLTFAFLRDPSGGVATDTTTDLSPDPPNAAGTGLTSSPPAALDVATRGFVDYVDAAGQWVGTGLSPPPAAVYVRRWSVQALAADPADTLVLQVFVTTVASDRLRGPSSPRSVVRSQGDVLLVSCRTRAG